MKAVVIPGSLPLAAPVINGILQVLQIRDFEDMVGENLNLSGPRSLKCFVSNLPCVALDYPHSHIILSRLCISNSNSLGAPWIHFLLKMKKHTQVFLLLFPLRLHPFLAVLSCILFSYLNMNSLLLFFISTQLVTVLLLVFAFLWCWCDIPEGQDGCHTVPTELSTLAELLGTEHHSLLLTGALLRAEMAINKSINPNWEHSVHG